MADSMHTRVRGRPTIDPSKRFMKRVFIRANDPEIGPCWLWSGRFSPNRATPLFWVNSEKKIVNAKYFAFEMARKWSPSPDQRIHMTNLCENKNLCIAPRHIIRSLPLWMRELDEETIIEMLRRDSVVLNEDEIHHVAQSHQKMVRATHRFCRYPDCGRFTLQMDGVKAFRLTFLRPNTIFYRTGLCPTHFDESQFIDHDFDARVFSQLDHLTFPRSWPSHSVPTVRYR